jgi:hypothetical protein
MLDKEIQAFFLGILWFSLVLFGENIGESGLEERALTP